ncbi:MAG: hypothetical protein K0S39_2916 [Paenibacillus sp.]|jgi:hypothetical protein|nr:hypothetical protein [Paenibacillus sp.]
MKIETRGNFFGCSSLVSGHLPWSGPTAAAYVMGVAARGAAMLAGKLEPTKHRSFVKLCRFLIAQKLSGG